MRLLTVRILIAHNRCAYSLSAYSDVYFTGVPKLRALGNYKSRQKKLKTCGVKMTNLLEVVQFFHQHAKYTLPSSISTNFEAPASDGTTLYIPQNYTMYDVEGVAMTGRTQLGWIGQLSTMPRQFVLHADGKYKLHHDKWILMSVGTHHLRCAPSNLAYSFMSYHCGEYSLSILVRLVHTVRTENRPFPLCL